MLKPTRSITDCRQRSDVSSSERINRVNCWSNFKFASEARLCCQFHAAGQMTLYRYIKATLLMLYTPKAFPQPCSVWRNRNKLRSENVKKSLDCAHRFVRAVVRITELRWKLIFNCPLRYVGGLWKHSSLSWSPGELSRMRDSYSGVTFVRHVVCQVRWVFTFFFL